jgi:peptidyl-prolyl cis-trans isomerase SurA
MPPAGQPATPTDPSKAEEFPILPAPAAEQPAASAPTAEQPVTPAPTAEQPPALPAPPAGNAAPEAAPGSTPSVVDPIPTVPAPTTAPPATLPPATPSAAGPAPKAPTTDPTPLVPAPPDPIKGSAASGDSARAAPTRDDQVRTASNDSTGVRSVLNMPGTKNAGKTAARVGDEVITYHELVNAVRDKLAASRQRPGALSRQQIDYLRRIVLDELIEESVIVQEAKRGIKKQQQLQEFNDGADKEWREFELPPLIRKYAVSNEYELKQRLADDGQSIEGLKERFRRKRLGQYFIRAKLGPKMVIELPEMLKYYNENIKEFERPAQITWRDAVVEVKKCQNKADAHKQILIIQDRLRRGEDFAKVVKELSHGPKRNEGGLWETTPGGYAVAAVNRELDSLPIGRISRIIVTPSAYHIVRVEGRRDAGPASFAEPDVQDKVRQEVHREKTKRIMEGYIAKLRAKTVVTTIFNDGPVDPALTRTNLTTKP